MLNSAKKRDAGVSLLEMLVVLAIVAATVALTAPQSLGPTRRVELEGVADDLAARLREARTRAITKASAVHVDFDIAAKRYGVTGDPRATELPRDVAISVLMARSNLTENGRARLTYFADGSSTGGDVRLSRSGRALNIKVIWLTGAVAVVSTP